MSPPLQTLEPQGRGDAMVGILEMVEGHCYVREILALMLREW